MINQMLMKSNTKIRHPWVQNHKVAVKTHAFAVSCHFSRELLGSLEKFYPRDECNAMQKKKKEN